MKKTINLLTFFFVIVLFGFKGGDEKKTAPADEQIKWYTFQQAYDLGKTKPKKIFIDVYTDWCGWCKKMDASTFKDPGVIKLMNKYFYAVKLNAEMKDTVRMDTVKFVNPNPGMTRSTHQLAAALLNNQMSYPTTVYLSEKFALLSQAIPGYQTPESIEPILVFLGEDLYSKQSWEEFQKTFKVEDYLKTTKPDAEFPKVNKPAQNKK